MTVVVLAGVAVVALLFQALIARADKAALFVLLEEEREERLRLVAATVARHGGEAARVVTKQERPKVEKPHVDIDESIAIGL